MQPTASSALPWMQRVPRFGVVDNQQKRPVPDLNPIRVSPKPTTPTTANQDEESCDGLETQIKLNAELLKRIEALESADKANATEIKLVQSAWEKSKKESAFYKAKYDEVNALCNKLMEKTAKHKQGALNDSREDKENMDVSNKMQDPAN